MTSAFLPEPAEGKNGSPNWQAVQTVLIVEEIRELGHVRNSAISDMHPSHRSISLRGFFEHVQNLNIPKDVPPPIGASCGIGPFWNPSVPQVVTSFKLILLDISLWRKLSFWASRKRVR